MFNKVNSRVSFPDMEREVLQYWKEHRIFEKSEEGEDKALFMFYEGPPTANGSPGIHHVLARAFKDVICRYKTMKGFRPLRKGGWDTHGLPVELEVERQLGFTSKRQIEEYGIERFNEKCRESVFKYVKEWEDLTDRIGYWVDMKDPYVTLHNSYIETGWWILKEMWEKGLIYKGMKGTPHCPRCVSSLEFPRGGVGLQGERAGPLCLCEVSRGGCLEPCRRDRRYARIRVPAGLDDNALDAAWKHRPRRGPRGGLLPGGVGDGRRPGGADSG